MSASETTFPDPDISAELPHLLAWVHVKPIGLTDDAAVASPGSAIPPPPSLDALTPNATEGLALYERQMSDPNSELRRWATFDCCRRYMIANKGHAEKAYIAMLETMRFRMVELPKHVDGAARLPERYRRCIATRFVEWLPMLDPEGRPCIWVTSRFADLSISQEERLNYVVAAMEEGVRRIEEAAKVTGKNVTQWNVLVDETDKRWKHVDNGFLRLCVPVVFAHYVERLHKFIIVNGGMLTTAAIGIGKLFVDARTASKLLCVDAEADDDGKRTPDQRLVDIVGLANIPKFLGGTYEEPPLQRAIDSFQPWYGGMLPQPESLPPVVSPSPAAGDRNQTPTPRPNANTPRPT